MWQSALTCWTRELSVIGPMKRCSRLGVPLPLEAPSSPLRLRCVGVKGIVDVAERGIVVVADASADPALELENHSCPAPQSPLQSWCAASLPWTAFLILSTWLALVKSGALHRGHRVSLATCSPAHLRQTVTPQAGQPMSQEELGQRQTKHMLPTPSCACGVA